MQRVDKAFGRKERAAIRHAEANGYERQGAVFAWLEPGPRKRIVFVEDLPLMRKHRLDMKKKVKTKTKPKAKIWDKQLSGQYIMDFDYDCSVVLVPLDNLKEWESWIKTADVYPPPALPDYVVPLRYGVSGAIFTDPIVLTKRLVKT